MPPAAAEEGAADGGDPADTETPPGHRDSAERGDPATTAATATPPEEEIRSPLPLPS